MTTPQRAIVSSLGPYISATGTPSATALTGPGVVNGTVGTTPTKILSAATDFRGRVRRCRLVSPGAAGNLGVALVDKGAAAPSTVTAVGDGTATDAPLLVGALGVSWEFGVADRLDLYIVGSGAGIVYQLKVDETD